MQKSWDGYITALGGKDTLPFPTSGGPHTGFEELKPVNVQTKYDAMTPEWEGISASNAFADLYKPEFMTLK
jgi:hypothetical protein